MTRKQTLSAIKVAGARGDHLTMLRLYAENRVSYDAAHAAYRQGYREAEAIERIVKAREMAA